MQPGRAAADGSVANRFALRGWSSVTISVVGVTRGFADRDRRVHYQPAGETLGRVSAKHQRQDIG